MKRPVILALAVLSMTAGCLNWEAVKSCTDDSQCNPGRICDTSLGHCVDGSRDGGGGTGPVVNSINGTGQGKAVSPRAEDQAFWNAHSSDRVPAANRISSATPGLSISGEGLVTVTKVELIGQSGQGTFELPIVGASASSLTTGWSSPLSKSGEFEIKLTTPSGSTTKQIYLMRGEQGIKGEKGTFTGTFTGNVSSAANLSVTGTATLGNLAVQNGYELTSCPAGYAAASAPAGVTLCRRGLDEMVKVGSFWIDRYEAVIVDATQYAGGNCDGAGVPYGKDLYNYLTDFPRTGNWTKPMYACSITGVKPSAYMTWFQAQEACSLSGKRLCTNEEWQAAAAGTYDTTGTETGNQCHIKTTNTSARNTGLAGSTPGGTDSCVSMWGGRGHDRKCLGMGGDVGTRGAGQRGDGRTIRRNGRQQ